jgi:DNA-binding NtrC family response regulator
MGMTAARTIAQLFVPAIACQGSRGPRRHCGKWPSALRFIQQSSVGRMKNSVLVIDDDDGVRDSCIELLRAFGFEGIAAKNGRQGLATYRQMRPAVVLTDLLLPNMDGIEIIREIRRIAPEAKIIAMSGGAKLDKADLLDSARLLGADATIPKPIDADLLLTTISRMLSSPDE